METTIKEITIKEIDAAYEILERILGMDGMESIKEALWQNFNGQAAGATTTGAEILRKMGDEASAKEIYDYYRVGGSLTASSHRGKNNEILL